MLEAHGSCTSELWVFVNGANCGVDSVRKRGVDSVRKGGVDSVKKRGADVVREMRGSEIIRYLVEMV